MASDRDLVQRAASGDRLAYRDLVQRYQTVIFGYAYFLTRDFDAGRRLARESLVRGFAEIQETGRPWVEDMLQIVNALHRQGRRLKSSSIVDPTATEEADANAPKLPPALLQAIAEELHSLEVEERTLLTLRHGGGLSPEEIAEATGEPASGVSSQIARCFKHLRDRLVERAREGGLSLGV